MSERGEPGDRRAAGAGAAPSSAASPGLTQRTIASALWLFSGTALQALLRLAVLTFLARLLGPGEFGLAAAALVVIGLFRLLLETGMRFALIQRPNLEERHLHTAFSASLALGVTSAAAIALGAPLAARAFAMPGLVPVIQVLCFLIPLQSLGIVARALLERRLRFALVVRTEVAAYVLGYATFGIPLALGGFGVWALVAANLAYEFVYAALALLAQPHPKALRIDGAALRELFYFGSGFLTASVGNFFALSGDKWVAGRWLGLEALGLYKYAYELTLMVAQLFAKVLDKVLFPAMAQAQRDPERLAGAYRRGVAMVALLVLPASASFFVLAPEIVELILGTAWQGAVPPFRVLALALLLRSTYKISDSLARAKGAVFRRAWRQFVYAASVIGLAWIGQHAGLAGLALGVTVGIAINFLLMVHLSVHLAPVGWRDVAAAHLGGLPSFAVTVLAVGLVAMGARELALPPLAVVAGSLTAGGAALLVVLRLAPRALLGSDGAEAVGILIGYADQRMPALARNPLVRTLLPRPLSGAR